MQLLQLVLAFVAGGGVAGALPGPVLSSNPFLQSPVRGGPGDLLILPGAGLRPGDKVVFARLADDGPLVHPTVPPDTTSERGFAPVVDAANVPNSIVVKLPSVMTEGRTYALWILRPPTNWSNGVRINDARPLWLTPAYMPASAALDFLPRELKVVGRNFNPSQGATTRVRLVSASGTPLPELVAAADPMTARYVARVTLPVLSTGDYNVSVSRDGGASWVALVDQALHVTDDPTAPATFAVNAYGGCAANDGLDDTACVQAAVNAAANAGGGEVVFGPGTWRLQAQAGLVDESYGIVLPPGVSLRGTGPGGFAPTTLERAATWPSAAVFTVQGRNQIRGFRFRDAQIYPLNNETQSIPRNTFFLLGKHLGEQNGGPSTVEDVVFHDNLFDGPFLALSDEDRPIRRLFVTDNEFGAYHDALYLAGPIPIASKPFRIDDSVIARNTFKPGRYYAPEEGQGTIATQLGASTRMDFSQNVADGRSTEYLQPGDRVGWRAAFFWHLGNNHEQLLISENVATCTGDKTGDGEFVAIDGNKGRFPADAAQAVLGASATGVTVPGVAPNIYPAGYFSEHWVFVAAGPGLGQARKVVAYTTTATTTSYVVAPGWEVVPNTASQVIVSRNAWQVYVVGNQVSQEGCLKPHKAGQLTQAGIISFWSPTTDSVIEANQQVESDGVTLLARYAPPFEESKAQHVLQYFNEVRGNTVNEEYDYDWQCSRGAIKLWYTANPDGNPIVPGYGVSVAHNTVRHADAMFGGAIAFEPAAYNPVGVYWSSTLVFQNDLQEIVPPDLRADPEFPFCGSTTRSGIAIGNTNVHDTVLSGNTCTSCDGVPELIDHGTGTVSVP